MGSNEEGEGERVGECEGEEKRGVERDKGAGTISGRFNSGAPRQAVGEWRKRTERARRRAGVSLRLCLPNYMNSETIGTCNWRETEQTCMRHFERQPLLGANSKCARIFAFDPTENSKSRRAALTPQPALHAP